VSASHGNEAVTIAKPTQTATVLDVFEKTELRRSHCDIFIGISRSFIFISVSQALPDELRSGAEPTVLGVAGSNIAGNMEAEIMCSISAISCISTFERQFCGANSRLIYAC
jgi:hypothetical protein